MSSLISVVMPVYNTNLKFVNTSIRSVQDQTISNSDYELVVFDDGSTNGVNAFLEKRIRGVPNGRFYRRTENKGAAITRNEAISQAQGKYIVALDDDDLLDPNALEETANFMETSKRVRYSYSQHRVIDKKGELISFTPEHAYDPDLLLHMNFVGHLKCFERDLHHEIGGYPLIRVVEDWAHVLEASRVLDGDQIAQNPKVLYSYRIHGDNLVLGDNKKLHSLRIEAVTKALKLRGIEAEVFWSHKTNDGYNYMDWNVR